MATCLNLCISIREAIPTKRFPPFFKFSGTFDMTAHLFEECWPREREKGLEEPPRTPLDNENVLKC